jgi:hypothetical protein
VGGLTSGYTLDGEPQMRDQNPQSRVGERSEVGRLEAEWLGHVLANYCMPVRLVHVGLANNLQTHLDDEPRRTATT